MITETEKKLIYLMIDLGAEDQLIHSVCSGMTEAQMEFMRLALLKMIKEKDKLSKEDILLTLVVSVNSI